MKINRRDFLKTTALTSMYFAGFGVPTFANSLFTLALVTSPESEEEEEEEEEEEL